MNTAISTFNPATVAEQSEVVSPSQSLTTSESSRTMAEIQSALTIAAARPRDEMRAIDKVKNACQRPRLAEISQYEYSKGGQKITGPTIHLLTVLAQHWGNIQFGFRELSQCRGESTVEAYAWDLESNTRRSVQFVVPHKIGLKGGKTRQITDPREVYEWVANQSQRRVRACLENVIPKDVIDEAVDQCNETLHAQADTSPEAVQRMVKAFEGLGVSKAQIEARIQRRLEAIAPAQLISLRRIYNSIKDGMSSSGDWFAAEEAQEKQADSGKASSVEEKLRSKVEEAASKPASEPVDSEAIYAGYKQRVSRTTKPDSLRGLRAEIAGDANLEAGGREDLLMQIDDALDAAGAE